MNPDPWFVPRAADFLLRDWDSGGVLYDILSGDTHRLGALHFELLHLLQERPRSLDDLHLSLGMDLPEHLDHETQRRLINDRLMELAAMQLIQAQTP